MALQASGPIALFLEIRAEEIVKTPSLSATDFGLREVSAAAGFTEPDLMSEFYGYSSVTPIVWTAAPVELGKNDISINIRQNSNTYNTGNGTITSKGFYYGTSTNINSATKVQVNTANNTDQFDRNFTGLSGGTTYRFWGYAINDAGETVSSRRDITTLATQTITYVNYGGAQQNYIQAGGWSYYGGYGWGNFYFNQQYHHPYYGWTNSNTSNVNLGNLRNNSGFYGTYTQRNAKANGTFRNTRKVVGSNAFHAYYGNGNAQSIGDVYEQATYGSYFSHNSFSLTNGGNTEQHYSTAGWSYTSANVNGDIYALYVWWNVPSYSLPAQTWGEQQFMGSGYRFECTPQ
jgi:hypothetical protein